jgi:DinB superfamily
MTTETTCCAAEIILPGAKMTLGLVQAMNADIPADKFARMPDGVDTNHPAWAMGHLSIYFDMVLELLGRPELAKPNDAYMELFKNGSQCKDDPNGTIYPSKDEIMSYFVERMNTTIDAVAAADGSVLSAANETMMSERFPTVGAVANFMLGHHVMMHVGQISAWRRAMGLGPCSMG